jgi:hypothetical protein
LFFQFSASEIFVHLERVKGEKRRQENPDEVLGVYDIAIIKLNKKVTFTDKVIYFTDDFNVIGVISR